MANAFVAISLLSVSTFAAAQAASSEQEAMKKTNPQAEAAAQSKVDARGQSVTQPAKPREAMTQGSDKSKSAAQAKVANKAPAAKKKAADEQMAKDAKML